MSSSIDTVLKSKKIVISCGTGGVGKTTFSAALAFRAALLGKKALVITIDPAKRLGTSLGLEGLCDEPTDITPRLNLALEKLRQAGSLPREFPLQSGGTLHAIIPDTLKTFDQLVSELSPNAAVAERLRRNPIFQIFARDFSGTNEYMAMERLHALHRESHYDCIILDTPPSSNTLAFLEAPRLLAGFFDERILRWLVLPANKLVSFGMKKILGILEKLTGSGFMVSLLDFGNSLLEIQTRFSANLSSIMELLCSSPVGFLVVTAAAQDRTAETVNFIKSLKNNGFRFEGIAVNRSLSYLQSHPSLSPDRETPELRSALELVLALKQRQDQAIEELRQSGDPVLVQLPELARDVHSVEDLLHVALALGPDHPV